MSEIMGEELFKTTLMGGFDKEDVLKQFNELKNNADLRESDLLDTIQKKDEEIERLRSQVTDTNDKMSQLNKDVDEKYKGYIDNVDMIGRIIIDTQIKAEQTVKEANDQKEAILAQANEDAEAKLQSANETAAKTVEDAENKAQAIIADATAKSKAMIVAAQDSVNEKINEGVGQYTAIQEEVAELLQFVNRVQHRFMQSIKTIQELSESMNISSTSAGNASEEE